MKKKYKKYIYCILILTILSIILMLVRCQTKEDDSAKSPDLSDVSMDKVEEKTENAGSEEISSEPAENNSETIQKDNNDIGAEGFISEDKRNSSEAPVQSGTSKEEESGNNGSETPQESDSREWSKDY